MNQTNYQTMSKQELKKYFLEHREDKKAFQEYLARRQQDSISTVTKAEDLLFDEKIQASIIEQMNQ